MKKTLYIIFICFAASWSAKSQNKAYIDSLFSIIKNSKSDTTIVNTYNLLSKEYKNTDPIRAFDYVFKALNLATEINFRKGIGLSYNRIGTIYLNQGNYPLATSFFQKSIKIFEEDNYKKGLGGCYINLGIVSYNQENYENAHKYLNKALTIYKLFNDSVNIANCYTNIGIVFHYQKKYEEALIYYFKSLRIQNAFNSKSGMAYCYNNIGCTYKEIGEFSKSEESLNKALILFQELFDIYDIAVVYNSLGELYVANNKTNQAIFYFSKALDISLKLKALDQVKLNNEGLSKSYAKLKNFKKAYEFHLTFMKNYDSIFNDENIKKITQMEMNYEFDKKIQEQLIYQEQEEAFKKAEIDRQKTLRNIFLFGFIFTVLFVLFAFNSFRIIYHTNKKLNRQKSEIQEQKNIILFKNQELNEQKEEILSQKDKMILINNELGKKNIFLSKGSSYNSEMNISVILTNEKGNPLWVNDDFIKLYGFTLEDYMYYYPSIFKRNDDKEEALNRLSNNHCYSSEFEIKTKSEENIKIRSMLIPIFDQENKLTNILAIDNEILGNFNSH